MKKLSKQRLAEKAEWIKKLGEARGDLENAVSDYNQIVADAAAWRDEIVSEMEDYANERSEKWPESDAGQAFESWKQEWESASIEEADVEIPEPVDLDLPCDDDLDGLPDEAS